MEADGSSCEKAEYRYVLSLKMADSRGEMNVNLFNKEVSVGGDQGSLAGDETGGSGDVSNCYVISIWRFGD